MKALKKFQSSKLGRPQRRFLQWKILVQNLGHEQEFDSLSVVLVQLTNFGQEIADGHVFVATLKSPLETSC